MRTRLSVNQTNHSFVSAFTLPEVMLGVLVILITFGGFYLGFSQGFAIIQVARENLRATQILQEKAETIRLFTWDQIEAATTGTYVTTNYFYPRANSGGQGVVYRVERAVSSATSMFSAGESYVNDIKLVTFTIKWTSGSLLRQRQMQTLVAQYGLHNYIFYGRY